MNSVLEPIDYLSPDVPESLPWHEVPVLRADADNLKGYGCLVDDAEKIDIEIVQWPAQGWRPVDAGTGDEGGVVEGVFHTQWVGDVLNAHNDAVQGEYILGWRCNPGEVNPSAGNGLAERVLLWHMNYHPDGGQLFFPQQNLPFVVPLALSGDDLGLEKIVAFWCDGSQGLYIHPGIWHDGVFPVMQKQSFRDRQGRVHARVSCNIVSEFGVFLNVGLPEHMD